MSEIDPESIQGDAGAPKAKVPPRDHEFWDLRDHALCNFGLDLWARADGMPDPALRGRAYALVNARKRVVCLANDLHELREWLNRRKAP